jgi:hypothetical protein
MQMGVMVLVFNFGTVMVERLSNGALMEGHSALVAIFL